MILSDVSIRKALAEGRIVIDPLDEGAIQPSSVDLRIDRYFRVFRNYTTPYIDPKVNQEDLTELVEVPDGEAFVLHPGEFVLGSTLERVVVPDDMVGRLEGKSSVARLGLLIHSSLPGSEPLLLRVGDELTVRPIEEVVRKRLGAEVVAFDPRTLQAGYFPITGWYEGPADRIFEVRLRSGRSVRVTAGHNLFTLDRDGKIAKVRTGELRAGMRVAVPRRIPDPIPDIDDVVIRLLDVLPERLWPKLVVRGDGVSAGWDAAPQAIVRALRDLGIKHTAFYRERRQLPLAVALSIPEVRSALRDDDRVSVRGGRSGLPLVIQCDEGFTWLLGFYVAEGSHRANQVVWSNTDPALNDRVEAELDRLGVPRHRNAVGVTAMSGVLAHLIDALEMGDSAPEKHFPALLLTLPTRLLQSFLDGLVDGDGSRDDFRTSVWTSSPALVSDLLLLGARLGRRVGSCFRDRSRHGLYQVYFAEREHKLLTSVPLPDRLLREAREAAGLGQVAAARRAGYRHATDLNNVENRHGREHVRFSTLRRLRDAYAETAAGTDALRQLDRVIAADMMWDEVKDVRDTGVDEPVYDIEVRPGGLKIENFVAGTGGVFVSNTAGFVDAGWDGYLTLELSNVANLPIAIYPAMKIGQISFLQMTSAAEHPYGGDRTGSKYQGQRGPTPSRYYLNFRK